MIVHQPTNSRKNYNYNAFIYTNTRYDSHFHSNYELICVLEGDTAVTVNGTVYRLSAGELLLLPPFAVHSFRFCNVRVWVGVFSEDHIPAFAAKHGREQFSAFRLSPDADAFLRRHLFVEGTPPRYLAISCLYLMCNECLQNATPIQAEIDPALTHFIIDYISKHLNEDVSLHTLAEQCNYEYHYFSAIFHQCFSMNFKSFLNIFRIERACALLSDPARDITEIYRACGFSSIRNFNRVFKQLMDCTPTQYRGDVRFAQMRN